jgi:hypothetical protein
VLENVDALAGEDSSVQVVDPYPDTSEGFN